MFAVFDLVEIEIMSRFRAETKAPAP